MMDFEEYDNYVIKEIARHEVEPSIMTRLLETTGKPIDYLMEKVDKSENKFIKRAASSIDFAIETSLKTSIKAAKLTTNDKKIIKGYKKKLNIDIEEIKDIQELNLRQMDRIADTFNVSNALFLGVEGGGLGAATLSTTIPYAQFAIPTIIAADVASSITLLSRHMCQIATSCGYSPSDIVNIPYILSAMAPQSKSSDEGFIFAKTAAITEIRNSVRYATNHTGELVADIMSPQLIKLIRYVTQRLSITITQKELGLILPFVGAALNCSLNVTFQQMNHTSGKDYFRKMYLHKKYGEKVVMDFISDEKSKLLKVKEAS